jgi:hypothetical protein
MRTGSLNESAMIAACSAAGASGTAAIIDRTASLSCGDPERAPYWTTSVISFDTPLVPHVFVARRRTK